MRHRRSGLWNSPEFLKLWAAQSISFVGSTFTDVALPLLATLSLQATATQMGLLRTAALLPTLLFGLVAGVLIDRLRRRPLLIVADIGRALLLASLPVASYLGVLHINQLLLVAFLGGVLTLLFDIAHMSLLPRVVARDRLVEGNSKLELSRSIAMVLGPGLAGALVQLATAALTVMVDAVSFLGSAILLGWMRVAEPAPAPAAGRPRVLSEVAAGLRMVWRQPLLRTMALSLCVFNFWSSAIGALYVLYVVGELGISPATLGLIYALGSFGFVFGAALAGRVARRWGIGPAIVWGAGISDAAFVLIPLAAGSSQPVALLIAAQLVASLGGPITAINQLSLRQSITPDEMQGRINASMRVISLAAAPAGALLAGVAGGALGLWPTLAVAAAGIQLGFVVLLLSPLRRMKDEG